MLRSSKEADENGRSKRSRSQRRLQIESLESRTLLSAAPWNAPAVSAEVPPGDWLPSVRSAEPPAALVAAVHPAPQDMAVKAFAFVEQLRVTITEANHPPLEPVELPHIRFSSMDDGQTSRAIAQKPQASEHTVGSTPSLFDASRENGMLNIAAGRWDQLREPAAPLLSPPPNNARQPVGEIPLDTNGAPVDDAMGNRFDDLWLPQDMPRMPAGSNDDFVVMYGIRERMTQFPTSELSADWGRDLGPGTLGHLLGTGPMNDFVAIASGGLGDSFSPENGSVVNNIAESSLPLLTNLDEEGFVSLSTYQKVGATSVVLEMMYGVNSSYSPSTDWTGIARPTTSVSTESELQNGSRAILPSLGDILPSTVDAGTEGGLIDIESEIFPSAGTLRATDTTLSGDSHQQDVWTILGRHDQVPDDELPPEGEGNSFVAAGILADAALDTDWDADSDQGGMIELAAVLDTVADPQTQAAAASASGHGKWRDVQIDKGLGRFQAFEVATALSDHPGEGETRSERGAAPDLPIGTTASADVQDSTAPEASASAATEPHAETDRHAAAAPAIIGLSLMSGASRKKLAKSPADDSRKSRVI